MNLPLILASIVFVGWGTGDLFTIVAARRIGANLTVFWVFFSSLILSLILMPFVPHNFQLITFPLLLLNIFLGILYVVGNVLVTEAFRLSSAPLVGIIIQSFPAVVLVLSALFFKDKITTSQAIYTIIIFTGIFLSSVDIRKLLTSQKLIDRGTSIALLAMVCLSIYFTFLRIPINAYGWFLPNFIGNACFPIIYFFLRARKEKFSFPTTIPVLVSVLMVGLLIKAGDFSLNWGLSIPGASSLVAPIAGASPILFVTLSALIFKDKVTKQQVFGILVTLIGIVLLTTLGQS
ncbi:MAG: DMT family transporter [Patescibacteria group bacterium]